MDGFPAPFIKEVFSLVYDCNLFLEMVPMNAWVYFWVFCSVPMVYTLLRANAVLTSFFRLQWNLKLGIAIPPPPLFLLTSAWTNLGLLCFHLDSATFFPPISVQTVIGSMMGIVLSLWTAFGDLFIFRVIRPIHPHEKSFPLPGTIEGTQQTQLLL